MKLLGKLTDHALSIRHSSMSTRLTYCIILVYISDLLFRKIVEILSLLANRSVTGGRRLFHRVWRARGTSSLLGAEVSVAASKSTNAIFAQRHTPQHRSMRQQNHELERKTASVPHCVIQAARSIAHFGPLAITLPGKNHKARSN